MRVGGAQVSEKHCNFLINHGEATAADIENLGRKAIALECEISSFDEVKTLVETAVNELGSVQILVNNAGMNWDGVSWKMSEEQWDRVL